MATPAYMSITGTKQGLITAGAFTEDSVGNTYQEGHEDQVMVQGFNHEVIIPRDPQSGQPTGQRVHKPVVITKVFDKASPLLLAALTSGERLTKVEIQWYRTSAAGTQEHYYTTVLEDAIIVDIKDYMHNCQDPGNAHFTHLEDVHFTYRKITWTHEVSGTSGSDDWRSPVLNRCPGSVDHYKLDRSISCRAAYLPPLNRSLDVLYFASEAESPLPTERHPRPDEIAQHLRGPRRGRSSR